MNEIKNNLCQLTPIFWLKVVWAISMLRFGFIPILQVKENDPDWFTWLHEVNGIVLQDIPFLIARLWFAVDKDILFHLDGEHCWCDNADCTECYELSVFK